MAKTSGQRAKIACLTCGRKKIRCPQKRIGESCEACAKAERFCEWPEPDAQVSGGPQHKTSCDGCRKDKVRCPPSKDYEDRTCLNCKEKGVACSYATAGDEAHEEQPGQAEAVQPTAGPSNYPGALYAYNGSTQPNGGPVAESSHRPALTVDPTAAVGGAASTSSAPATRASSPRSNFWEVTMAPSPEAETNDEELLEAYQQQQ